MALCNPSRSKLMYYKHYTRKYDLGHCKISVSNVVDADLDST